MIERYTLEWWRAAHDAARALARVDAPAAIEAMLIDEDEQTRSAIWSWYLHEATQTAQEREESNR